MREISNCCKAQLTVNTGDEGTSCYICKKCGNAADLFVETTRESDWKENITKAFFRNKTGFATDDTFIDYVVSLCDRAYQMGKKEIIDFSVKLSDEIELECQTSLEEWKAFKRFRNTLRDLLSKGEGVNNQKLRERIDSILDTLVADVIVGDGDIRPYEEKALDQILEAIKGIIPERQHLFTSDLQTRVEIIGFNQCRQEMIDKL